MSKVERWTVRVVGSLSLGEGYVGRGVGGVLVADKGSARVFGGVRTALFYAVGLFWSVGRGDGLAVRIESERGAVMSMVEREGVFRYLGCSADAEGRRSWGRMVWGDVVDRVRVRRRVGRGPGGFEWDAGAERVTGTIEVQAGGGAA